MAEIHHPLEPRPNGPAAAAAAAATTSSETLGSKRQRRPSVRLGEIGSDQLYDSAPHPRRATSSSKQLKTHPPNHQSHHLSDSDNKKDGNSKASSSRSRVLTNLTTEREAPEEKEINLDTVAIGSSKVKDSKRRVVPPNATVRRARSNWGKDSQLDDGGGGGEGNNGMGVEEKYIGGEEMEEDEEDGYDGREFNVEISESPLEEVNVNSSPVNSVENLGDGSERHGKGLYYDSRKAGAFRRLNNRSHHLDRVDLSGPSDNDVRDYGNNDIGCRGGGEDGVRIWLNSIGLGRYAPVFEIHEVDDEVLPLLTLEDLKDMGISAVGSRRKMFCAIQKLGSGFS